MTFNNNNGNLILEFYTGSKLYGTDNEYSDTDIIGVYMFHINEALSLKSTSMYNLNIKNEIKSKCVDKTYHEMKKYFNMLHKGSLNMMESLYIPDDKLIHYNYYYQMIRENRDMFICKKLFHNNLCFLKNEIRQFLSKLNSKKLANIMRLLTEYNDLFHLGVLKFPLDSTSSIKYIKTITDKDELLEYYNVVIEPQYRLLRDSHDDMMKTDRFKDNIDFDDMNKLCISLYCKYYNIMKGE